MAAEVEEESSEEVELAFAEFAAPEEEFKARLEFTEIAAAPVLLSEVGRLSMSLLSVFASTIELPLPPLKEVEEVENEEAREAEFEDVVEEVTLLLEKEGSPLVPFTP